jgi:hypothetical protein
LDNQPLFGKRGGVKSKKDDPTTKISNSKNEELVKRNIKKNKRAEYLCKSKKSGTFGKGWMSLNGVATQTGIGFLIVILVIDLTLFSRSFVARSFFDTREGSAAPE